MTDDVQKRVGIALGVTGLTQVQSGMRAASREVDQFGARVKQTFASLQAQVAGLVGAYGFGSLVRTGINFNQTLERARIGIAAIQQTADPKRFASFNSALQEADKAVNLLKEAAKTSPASFQQLVGSFQGVSAAATQAGIGIENQVRLINIMSQALSGLGIESHQMLQETRALIMGQIDINARAAKLLNITAADIRNARAKGQLYEFLMDKLKSFGEAAKIAANGYEVSLSNLNDAIEQFMGEQTRGLVQQMAAAFRGLTAVIQSGGFRQFVEELKSLATAGAITTGLIALTSAIQKLGAAITAAFGVSSLKSIADLTAGLSLLATKPAGPLAVLAAEIAALAASILILVDAYKVAKAEAAKGKAQENLTTTQENVRDSLVAGIGAAVADGRITEAKAAELQAALDAGFATKPTQVFKSGGPYGRLAIENLPDLSARQATINQVGAALREAEGQARQANETQAKTNDLMAEYLRGVSELAEKMDQLEAAQAKVNAAQQQAAGDQEWLDLIEAQQQADADAVERMRTQAELDVRTQERSLRLKQDQLAAARGMAEADFRLNSVERREQQLRFLEQERDLLAEQARLARAKWEAAAAPEVKALYEQQVLVAEAEARRAQMSYGYGMATADPRSLVDQMQLALAQLRDQFGTLAQQIARSFVDVIGTAVNSVTDGIVGLIEGTMTWADALRNVARTISHEILTAIVQMFVRWIIQRTILSTVERSLAAQEATAKMPGALATSVSSFGVAAMVGTAALLAGLAAIAGAFKEGGYTGDGDPSAPAGIVHRGEYVMSAPAVSRLGVDTLHAIETGAQTAGPSAGGGVGKVTFAFYGTRTEAIEALKSNEGRAVLVDLMRQHAHEFMR